MAIISTHMQDLEAVTEAAETDELVLANGGSNAVKKSTLANLGARLLNAFSWSALATTAKTIIGAINELNTNLTKKQDSLSGYVYVGSSEVDLTFTAVATNSSQAQSATFTDTSGATVYIPICKTSGWILPLGLTASKSNTTVTVSASGWNFSNGTHGGQYTIIVHKFKKIS